MKIKFILLAGVLAFAASLQATTSYTFSFAGADAQSTLGGALSFPMTGLTVTVKAYSTGNTSSTAMSNQNYVGEYSGNGIGICTGTATSPVTAEGANCGSPQHQVDNANQYEFLLLTFSAPVSLGTVLLGNFGTTGSTVDMDMSYWINPSASLLANISTTGQNNVLCGGTSQPACNAAGLTDTLVGTNVTSLLIGALYNPGVTSPDSNPDYFKVNSITVTTPEPASFVLIGSGLLFGAIISRRRLLKAKA